MKWQVICILLLIVVPFVMAFETSKYDFEYQTPTVGNGSGINISDYYVPYSGATNDVNLGSNDIIIGKITTSEWDSILGSANQYWKVEELDLSGLGVGSYPMLAGYSDGLLGNYGIIKDGLILWGANVDPSITMYETSGYTSAVMQWDGTSINFNQDLGSIDVSGNIIASGNITGDFIFGNCSTYNDTYNSYKDIAYNASYVTYTDATGNIDLGDYNITTNGRYITNDIIGLQQDTAQGFWPFALDPNIAAATGLYFDAIGGSLSYQVLSTNIWKASLTGTQFWHGGVNDDVEMIFSASPGNVGSFKWWHDENRFNFNDDVIFDEETNFTKLTTMNDKLTVNGNTDIFGFLNVTSNTETTLGLDGTGSAYTVLRFLDDGIQSSTIYTANGLTDLHMRAGVGGSVFFDGDNKNVGHFEVRPDGNLMGKSLNMSGHLSVNNKAVYFPNMVKCSDLTTACSDGDTITIKIPTGRLCCV